MPADALESRLHDLGEFIRDQRRNARLSLRKLSERAGISNPYLSQIERGLRKPSAEILQAIARACASRPRPSTCGPGSSTSATTTPDRGRRAPAIPTLTERQKQVLVDIYRSFRPNDGRADERPTATARVDVGRRPGPEERHRPAVWVPSPPDVSAPRRRLQRAHVAAGPAGSGRRRRHERLRARARVRARPGRRRVRRLHARRAPELPDVVEVEPGFRVVHVEAGPLAPRQARAARPRRRVRRRGARTSPASPTVDVLHANYWLSGAVGHRLKHELDLPLVATFHTLAG